MKVFDSYSLTDKKKSNITLSVMPCSLEFKAQAPAFTLPCSHSQECTSSSLWVQPGSAWRFGLQCVPSLVWLIPAHARGSWQSELESLQQVLNSSFKFYFKLFFLNSFPCRWEAICTFHQHYLRAALVLIPHPNLSCSASHLTPAATGALGWNSGVQLLSSSRNSLFCCSDTMTNLDWGKILGEYIGEVGALGLFTHCSCLLSFFKWKHFLCRDAQPTA